MTAIITTLNARQRAILRVVAAGRAEMICSCEPDLLVDGVPCCDQITAHNLAHTGHVRPTLTGQIGQRVAAALTDLGRLALEACA